jgi:hypothetical protein
MNKVVVRFADGRMLKGTAADFLPGKDLFHVSPAGDPEAAGTVAVHVAELKAVFFVKDFAGNPEYSAPLEPDAHHPTPGRRIKVVFDDGEVVEGTTTGYQPTRPGFFVEPADPSSNNERCYVIAAATREVSLL